MRASSWASKLLLGSLVGSSFTSVGARESFGDAGEIEPAPGSTTDDVTGMEAEDATAEPMGGSGQEAETGAGAADLGDRGGYIRPTADVGGTEASPEGLLLGEDKVLPPLRGRCALGDMREGPPLIPRASDPGPGLLLSRW